MIAKIFFDRQGWPTLEPGMEDKEVGKLWRWLHDPAPIDLPLHRECRELIRKLVDERASVHIEHGADVYEGLMMALENFGIREETWKTEK